MTISSGDLKTHINKFKKGDAGSYNNVDKHLKLTENLHKYGPALLFEDLRCLLICLTLSSRKDLSIAPCFIGGFSIHMQGISRGEIL